LIHEVYHVFYHVMLISPHFQAGTALDEEVRKMKWAHAVDHVHKCANQNYRYQHSFTDETDLTIESAGVRALKVTRAHVQEIID
jgi:hypothetical protein